MAKKPAKTKEKKKAPKPKTYHTYRAESGQATRDLPNAIWLLRPSWRALLLNIMEVGKLFGLPVFMVAVAILSFYIASVRRGTVFEALFNGLGAVAVAGGVALIFAILPAFGLVQLRSARQEVANFWDEFHIGLPLFWRYVGTYVLVALLSIGGLVSLIIPGLFVMQRFMLAPYYVLDQETGVFEAMRRSAADAREFKRPMWSLALLVVFSRLIFFAVAFGGPFVSGFLQTLYGYAPAVRYVEIQEAKRRRQASR